MDKITKYLPKGLQIREQLLSDMKKGLLGKPGAQFPQVRALSAEYAISLVTAQKIVFMLKDEGFLERKGKRYILAANGPTLGRSLRIGVITTMLDNPFFAALLKNIEISAAKQKIEIMSASSNYIGKREKELLDVFEREKFDGILACPCDDESSAPNFRKLKLPYVLIGRKIKNLEADTVLVQNFSAGQTVARHLISSGKKNFGYIGMKNYPCDPRFEGFRSGLSEEGFHINDSAIIKADNNRIDDVLPEMKTFLRKLQKPAGVFCFHDILAARLMRVASEMKIRIPSELGVVGFDNLPIAAELTPSLSSVAYPIDRMAETALEILLRRINGDKGHFVSNSIDPLFISRESTLGKTANYEYMSIRNESMAYNLA